MASQSLASDDYHHWRSYGTNEIYEDQEGWSYESNVTRFDEHHNEYDYDEHYNDEYLQHTHRQVQQQTVLNGEQQDYAHYDHDEHHDKAQWQDGNYNHGENKRRPRRNAKARREQYRRSETRTIERLISNYDAMNHRGCEKTKLGQALHDALRATQRDAHASYEQAPQVQRRDNAQNATGERQQRVHMPICRHWLQHRCTFGEQCKFAHGADEANEWKKKHQYNDAEQNYDYHVEHDYYAEHDYHVAHDYHEERHNDEQHDGYTNTYEQRDQHDNLYHEVEGADGGRQDYDDSNHIQIKLQQLYHEWLSTHSSPVQCIQDGEQQAIPTTATSSTTMATSATIDTTRMATNTTQRMTNNTNPSDIHSDVQSNDELTHTTANINADKAVWHTPGHAKQYDTTYPQVNATQEDAETTSKPPCKFLQRSREAAGTKATRNKPPTARLATSKEPSYEQHNRQTAANNTQPTSSSQQQHDIISATRPSATVNTQDDSTQSVRHEPQPTQHDHTQHDDDDTQRDTEADDVAELLLQGYDISQAARLLPQTLLQEAIHKLPQYLAHRLRQQLEELQNNDDSSE